MNAIIRGAWLSFLVFFLFFAEHSRAGPVGPSGYTNAFTTQPATADWATLNRTGAPSDVYDSDTDVNANITAGGVVAQTTADAGNPPGTATTATWSSTRLYLQTRPKSNRYVALMGKFVNDTGTNATQIRFSYLYTIAAGGTAEDSGKGTRVYYSMTGLANSWINLPTLNHVPTVNISSVMGATLTVNWTNGASFYVLFVDDNSNNIGDDAANQIDNFSLQVTAGVSAISAVEITSPSKAIRVASGTNLLLTATATSANGRPVSVYFFDNTQFIGVATNAPFSIVWSNLSAGIHTLTAEAADDLNLDLSSAPVVVEVLSSNAIVVLDPDFGGPPNWLLQGSAALVTNRIRLSPAVSNRVGAVWLDGKQLVQHGFETVFQFQISKTISNGGDGIAFVILNSDSPALGDLGAGMGYGSVTNSLAVEFDTFQNPEAADLDGNHISVHSRGTAPNSADESASLGRTASLISIADGAIHTVLIRYSWGVLRVFLDDLDHLALEIPMDIGALLHLDNGTAWVGFTAATGVEFENHDILMLSFRPNTLPQVQLIPVGAGPFVVPTNILISASAFDPDGEIAQVDFYANNNFIGTFGVLWNNPPAGTYSLTAKVTDEFGAVATSLAMQLPVFAVPRVERAAAQDDRGVAFEFATISGQTYTIQYSADLLQWTNAVPTLISTGALLQWHDVGPPVTESLPGNQLKRFYRVVVSP